MDMTNDGIKMFSKQSHKGTCLCHSPQSIEMHAPIFKTKAKHYITFMYILFYVLTIPMFYWREDFEFKVYHTVLHWLT